MTPSEPNWLNSNDPQAMLRDLCREASDRKLHLFACACCRRNWHLLPNEQARRNIEIAERRADGVATEEDQAAEGDFDFAEWDRTSGLNDYVYAYATEAVTQLGHENGYDAAAGAADQASAAAATAACRRLAFRPESRTRSTMRSLARHFLQSTSTSGGRE